MPLVSQAPIDFQVTLLNIIEDVQGNNTLASQKLYNIDSSWTVTPPKLLLNIPELSLTHLLIRATQTRKSETSRIPKTGILLS